MGLSNLRPGNETKEPKSFMTQHERKVKLSKEVKAATVALNAKKAINKKKVLRSRQRKLKRYDLSSLSKFLPELDAPKQCSTTEILKINCKSRQKLVMREGARLQALLNNPSIVIDPISAIHQHLLRTQSPPDNQQSKKNRKKGKRGKKASSIQSMDI
ncbi:uncharacterized protein [Typha angustifolia]|uniref:uncharacterized protein n=1 Tax=Typha angustifolia TaxID=59011 RepID=UPI003C2CD0DD